MHVIDIADHQSAIEVSEEEVREIVGTLLREEGIAEAELAIALVDDGAIHRVNRDHLSHDCPTDVISFLYDVEVSAGKAVAIDGELLVSTQTALREAARYGWRPLDELTLYLVHGLLHLCGYDDRTEAERRIMRAREEAILKNWDLTPHYRYVSGPSSVDRSDS